MKPDYRSAIAAHTGFSRLLSCCAMMLSLAACAGLSPRPVMPISEVVSLGASPQQAIERLRAAKTSYALRGSDFGRLAARGVAPQVLDHLQQSFVNDVDLLTRYWVLGESLGACGTCYPQPLDLPSLDRGGNGMADATGVHRRDSFARPQGLPEWVSAVPGSASAKGITVADVSRMVADGTPPQRIVATIRGSRLHGVIGIEPASNISTHLLAGLSGSTLATLHKSGATDAVVDALQEKYLAEFIEFNRVRYQSWGKGSVQN